MAFSRTTLAVVMFTAATVGLAGLIDRADARHPLLRNGFNYEAFSQLRSDVIEVPGGAINLAIAPGRLSVTRSEIIEWATRSGRAVAKYFGRFPVRSAVILIVPVEGDSVESGEASADDDMASVRVFVGHRATRQDLDEDSIMVHEMTHLAFPDVEPEHNWIHEGLATYLEHVARAKAGLITEKELWDELISGMQSGLPSRFDAGLNQDRSTRRVYWGGALFCLLADVEIRKRTANRFGLEHALRAISQAGGQLEAEWTMSKVIATADKAVGTPVFADLYRTMKDKAFRPDLAKLWRDLGIESEGRGIRLEDTAPLSSVRHAIATPDPRPVAAR